MFINMNNIVGGGDSWICDEYGIPDERIITTNGNTSLSFTIPSTEYGYQVYVECADGVAPPKITVPVFNGTTMTFTVLNVTAAQRGSSGNECKISVRVIK